MLHFLRTALLAVLFCLATSAFSQREAVIGIAPDYSSYATLISQQDTSLVFVTDQRDTVSLTILKKPWKMMSRIGTLRPGDRYALIVQADALPGVVYSYVNLTQLQQRWISLTDGNTLVFSPGGGLCGSASVSLDNYRIDTGSERTYRHHARCCFETERFILYKAGRLAHEIPMPNT